MRYLYKVLAERGISLADWIRTHRLEACRQELARACPATIIAAVARRHGFCDMSSFSRAFRAEYGCHRGTGATTASLSETAWGPGPTESRRVAGYPLRLLWDRRYSRGSVAVGVGAKNALPLRSTDSASVTAALMSSRPIFCRTRCGGSDAGQIDDFVDQLHRRPWDPGRYATTQGWRDHAVASNTM